VPPSIDVELKYIYSSFTKLPALSVRSPGPKIISELKNDPSIDCAIPLDSFKTSNRWNVLMLIHVSSWAGIG